MLTPRKPVRISFVEVIVVLAIVALLVVILVPALGPAHSNKVVLTRVEMRKIWQALAMRYDDDGTFLDGLEHAGELSDVEAQALADYVDSELRDAWWRPLRYEQRSEAGIEFLRIRSLGPDGEPDATDDGSGDDLLMDLAVVTDWVTSRDPKQTSEWHEVGK